MNSSEWEGLTFGKNEEHKQYKKKDSQTYCLKILDLM